MKLLFFAAAYLIMHLLTYILYGRHSSILKNERGIFLFHFISFVVFIICFAATSYLANQSESLYIATAGIALHGIYSLSFLELWSLSQGGYSISILRLSPITTDNEDGSLQKLEEIGNLKFSDRLKSLENLGMLKRNNNEIIVTTVGAIFTGLLKLFVKLTNCLDVG